MPPKRILAALLLVLPAAACTLPSKPPGNGLAPAGRPPAAEGRQPSPDAPGSGDTSGPRPDEAALAPRRVTVKGREGQTEALLFGRGRYGVVLAHGAIYDAASWTPLAREIARAGMVALAVEDIAPERLLDAIAHLRETEGARAVALIGASAGGASAIRAVERAPDAVDQLILLSARGEVGKLGDAPKLFVASEDEAIAGDVRRMAAEAPGQDNELLLLPGAAHAQAIFRTEQGPRLTRAILERLLRRAAGP